MEEFRICSCCHRRKPIEMFERGDGEYYKTCIRCRERKRGSERIRGGILAEWDEIMGLASDGLIVRPARRRPGDRPGWMEVI